MGLGSYLTLCARQTAIPASCSFTQQAGYIIDAVVTTNFFILLIAAVFVWRKKRNLVIVSSITITAGLALAKLVVDIHPDENFVFLLFFCARFGLPGLFANVARP